VWPSSWTIFWTPLWVTLTTCIFLCIRLHTPAILRTKMFHWHFKKEFKAFKTITHIGFMFEMLESLTCLPSQGPGGIQPGQHNFSCVIFVVCVLLMMHSSLSLSILYILFYLLLFKFVFFAFELCIEKIMMNIQYLSKIQQNGNEKKKKLERKCRVSRVAATSTPSLPLSLTAPTSFSRTT
jgi:hypothetical protein